MSARRGVIVTALAASIGVGSCTDGVSYEESHRRSLALAVAPAFAISEIELSAIGAAFDDVDQYDVLIRDSLTLEVYADVVIPVSGGTDAHILDIDVTEEALERILLIDLAAIDLDRDLELYGAETSGRPEATGGLSGGTSEVDVPIRYTGPGLRGVLTDEAGAGVTGVTVSLLAGASPVATATSGDDGSYLFIDVAAGSYVVEPTPPAGSFLCPAAREVVVSTSDDVLVADFSVEGTICGTDVLLISGGDFDDTGAAAAELVGSGLNVSTFFYVNETPGLDVLRDYDAVLLFMNGLFDESVSLGSEIAAYVDLGGNVVMASFYWQGQSGSGLGSPGWGDLEDIDPFVAAPSGAVYSGDVLDVAGMTAHPLTTGLTSITSTGFRGGVAARTGTTVVASWEDGTPFIGYKVLGSGQRLVAVSLFPSCCATGDTSTLWQNALSWAAAAGGPVPVAVEGAGS